MTHQNGILDLRPSMTRRLKQHVKTNGWTTVPMAEAKALRAEYRGKYGFKATYSPLLSAPGTIGKLDKGGKLRDFVLYGLSLAAAATSGVANVCQYSTPECRRFCLQEAGNGMYPAVHRARQARTALLFDHPDAFMTLLVAELRRAVAKHGEIGFRPNVLSDLPWELLDAPFIGLEGVHCYDYTKDWSRSSVAGYDLTFSVSERTTLASIMGKVADGGRCAIVLDLSKKQAVPATWRGMDCVDADLHDYRPLDGEGVLSVLRPKGTLTRESDFVRSLNHGGN